MCGRDQVPGADQHRRPGPPPVDKHRRSRPRLFFFKQKTAYDIGLGIPAEPLFRSDPVLYGNLPPREISMKDVFRSGDSSKKFKIAEGQWYRYAPSYVSPAYHLLEGFPFIQEPPSGDLQERVLIRHHDYDQCF